MSGDEAAIEGASLETHTNAAEGADKTAGDAANRPTSNETNASAFDETVEQQPYQETLVFDCYLQRSLWQWQWT
jgi:hypothetical protein